MGPYHIQGWRWRSSPFARKAWPSAEGISGVCLRVASAMCFSVHWDCPFFRTLYTLYGCLTWNHIMSGTINHQLYIIGIFKISCAKRVGWAPCWLMTIVVPLKPHAGRAACLRFSPGCTVAYHCRPSQSFKTNIYTHILHIHILPRKLFRTCTVLSLSYCDCYTPLYVYIYVCSMCIQPRFVEFARRDRTKSRKR